MPMKTQWLEGSFVRAIVYGLVAAGIVHICATLATPSLLGSGAYDRLDAELPSNRLVVLGPPKPQAQLLPFQEPHTHYAFCRYDAAEGPVLIKASLLSSGWTLALYSPGGDNFYVVPGQDQKVTDVSALLVPSGDEFNDLLPADQSAAIAAAQQSVLGPRTARAFRNTPQPAPNATPQVEIPSPTGLLVIRAPIKGQGYTAAVEAALARASCTRLPKPASTSDAAPLAPNSAAAVGPLSGMPPRPGL
jgi:uncharacterized membrane protein